MGTHVLVAMGRAERSARALEFALEEFSDAAITVIHVTGTSDPFDLFGTPEPEDYMVPDGATEVADETILDPNSLTRAQREWAECVFERAVELAGEYEREIDTAVRSGDAVEEIVDYAVECGADRIVVTDHQETATRPRLRDVSELVARRSDVPVTHVQ
ncbi:universal stress protein [Natronolimnohabitans innermongolicus]|uniref:UspA domain-containing protein n=1 Tax=Natronolimnohabitans innermongolicus JCM 12255 TaxID=1227499 RepID=L9XFW1_9EURY|nr:universal stress protein [Natronolimnohabitans innermongolicus]ELY60600.1 UspA domain-containing protein [Natronolimnohabitans innermongolicus JCM 12255]